MEYIKQSEGESHDFFDGAVLVNEFNFQDESINDAVITIAGRYPVEGYAVNDKSLAMISIEAGTGTIDISGSAVLNLEPGDRVLVHPGDPYALEASDKLVIRYIAAPAWTSSQARIVER